MNDDEKIQLQKMIHANSTEDNTNVIREKQNSRKIFDDIQTMLNLKSRYAAMPDNAEKQAMFENKCSFLFNNFKYLYEKIYKDLLELKILQRMLHVLAKIENNELDQHGASYEIGKFLKEVYVDTAIGEDVRPSKDIKWSDYKLMID